MVCVFFTRCPSGSCPLRPPQVLDHTHIRISPATSPANNPPRLSVPGAVFPELSRRLSPGPGRPPPPPPTAFAAALIQSTALRPRSTSSLLIPAISSTLPSRSEPRTTASGESLRRSRIDQGTHPVRVQVRGLIRNHFHSANVDGLLKSIHRACRRQPGCEFGTALRSQVADLVQQRLHALRQILDAGSLHELRSETSRDSSSRTFARARSPVRAVMRRVPAATDSSLTILHNPTCPVLLRCVPPQSSG